MTGRRPIDPEWAARRKRFGERLRAFRERAEMRPESVAHHLNMSALRVLRIEEGVSALPSEYLLAMAKLYDVSVAELVGERRERRATPETQPTTDAA